MFLGSGYMYACLSTKLNIVCYLYSLPFILCALPLITRQIVKKQKERVNQSPNCIYSPGNDRSCPRSGGVPGTHTRWRQSGHALPLARHAQGEGGSGAASPWTFSVALGSCPVVHSIIFAKLYLKASQKLAPL